MKWKLGSKNSSSKTGNEEQCLRVYCIKVLTQELNVKGCQFSVPLFCKTKFNVYICLSYMHMHAHKCVYAHIVCTHTCIHM